MTGDNNSLNSGKNYLRYFVILILLINIGVNLTQLYFKPNQIDESQFQQLKQIIKSVPTEQKTPKNKPKDKSTQIQLNMPNIQKVLKAQLLKKSNQLFTNLTKQIKISRNQTKKQLQKLKNQVNNSLKQVVNQLKKSITNSQNTIINKILTTIQQSTKGPIQLLSQIKQLLNTLDTKMKDHSTYQLSVMKSLSIKETKQNQYLLNHIENSIYYIEDRVDQIYDQIEQANRKEDQDQSQDKNDVTSEQQQELISQEKQEQSQQKLIGQNQLLKSDNEQLSDENCMQSNSCESQSTNDDQQQAQNNRLLTQNNDKLLSQQSQIQFSSINLQTYLVPLQSYSQSSKYSNQNYLKLDLNSLFNKQLNQQHYIKVDNFIELVSKQYQNQKYQFKQQQQSIIQEVDLSQNELTDQNLSLVINQLIQKPFPIIKNISKLDLSFNQIQSTSVLIKDQNSIFPYLQQLNLRQNNLSFQQLYKLSQTQMNYLKILKISQLTFLSLIDTMADQISKYNSKKKSKSKNLPQQQAQTLLLKKLYKQLQKLTKNIKQNWESFQVLQIKKSNQNNKSNHNFIQSKIMNKMIEFINQQSWFESDSITNQKRTSDQNIIGSTNQKQNMKNTEINVKSSGFIVILR